MTNWKIKLNKRSYVELEFRDRKLKLVKQSARAKTDKAALKLKKTWTVFDPRNTRLRDIREPKNIYDADLLIGAIFQGSKFTIESEGIDWSKVLEPAVPGRTY